MVRSSLAHEETLPLYTRMKRRCQLLEAESAAGMQEEFARDLSETISILEEHLSQLSDPSLRRGIGEKAAISRILEMAGEGGSPA